MQITKAFISMEKVKRQKSFRYDCFVKANLIAYLYRKKVPLILSKSANLVITGLTPHL